MFWSAVSLVLAVNGLGSDLNQRELRAWKKIEPSIVYVLDGPAVRGAAALIDGQGLFLADKSVVTDSKVTGKDSQGRTIHLILIATDKPTQLVLLKAEGWEESKAAPITLSESEAGSKSLIAITAVGPVRAERGISTYGVVSPSQRYMPLSEIRLENTEPALGGALLFNLDGQFAGALNATLETPPGQNNFTRGTNTGATGFGGGGNSNKIMPPNMKADLRSQYGPGTMATAYTIGPNVLRRVIEGFKSPSHEVHHPTIGIFCKDAVPVGGALIEIVSEGSTAEKAGLRKGDIINSINNQAVRSQFDFARIMIDQEIGNKLQIWISRDNLRQMIEVTVGAGVIKS